MLRRKETPKALGQVQILSAFSCVALAFSLANAEDYRAGLCWKMRPTVTNNTSGNQIQEHDTYCKEKLRRAFSERFFLDLKSFHTLKMTNSMQLAALKALKDLVGRVTSIVNRDASKAAEGPPSKCPQGEQGGLGVARS